MKVDLVVNSMIQQIDRNLQTQAMPALFWRPGELLRGRVMLAGDQLQIRLDSGALLNALPSADVLLSPGATVTLRVTGRTDDQLVMQLVGQEQDSDSSAPAPGAGARGTAQAGLTAASSSPQGRAAAQALGGMAVPLRDATVAQAVENMRTFPELGAEKAAFLAANNIRATREAVDALIGLVDGRVLTGDELARIAELVAGRAGDGENKRTQESAARPQTDKGKSMPADAPDDDPGERVYHQPGRPAPQASESKPAARNSSSHATSPEDAAVQGGLGGVMGHAAATPAGGGMARLQSLILVALGMDAAEQYSPEALALQGSGLVDEAVALALDGPFMSQDELKEGLHTLTRALPQDAAPNTEAFLHRLVDGLRNYMHTGAREQPAPARADDMPPGLPRVMKHIGELFVRLDASRGDGEALRRAVSAQRQALRGIASELESAGPAGREAARQVGRVESHTRLIDDISRYAYRQIPVQLDGRPRTAELYVLNRGGRGCRIDAANADILLALETEHLGRVETHIRVNGKSLRIRFGVQRADLMGYVVSQSAGLAKALQEEGFRVSDVRAQVVDTPVTPLNVTQRVGAAEPSGSLDVRL